MVKPELKTPRGLQARAANVDGVYPILLPFHLDEHRPGLDVPLRPELTLTPELPGGDTWARMTALYRPLADEVARLAAAGETPVVQSGDCTASLGIVAGLQRAGQTPAVVWFDAHGDVQTLETTTSGYLGGMPLRMIAGYRPELISTAIGLHPVPEEQLVLVDARDLDPPEQEYLDGSQIRHISADDVHPDVIPAGPIYLHLDLDVITPDDLPGQLFPAPGGPTAATVAEAVARVVSTGRVAAVGLGCTWREDAVRPAARVQAVVDALN